MSRNTRRILFWYGGYFLLLFFIFVVAVSCILGKSILFLLGKGIVMSLFFYPFYMVYAFLGRFNPIVFVITVVLIGGMVVSFILSLRRGRLFPWILLYAGLLTVWFFISFVGFLFFGGIGLRMKIDYSAVEGVEFVWHEGMLENFSFDKSDTVHIVSDVPLAEYPLTKDSKLALVYARTLIRAIEAFHYDKKEYPGSLEQLVPEYIKEVPCLDYDDFWGGDEFKYGKKPGSIEGFEFRFSGFFEDFSWHEERQCWWYEPD